MKVLHVKNVHDALIPAMDLLMRHGILRESRNGPVRQYPFPVTTVYENPLERVMFHAFRDANPFFHFYEALWMLGGRNDLRSVAKFAQNMRNYSDDGFSLNGAYGYRWRQMFGVDQLKSVVAILNKNKQDRRAVIQMWDSRDLGNPSKDVPCNTIASVQINSDNYLELTVFCRSNDIIWGCYGANAVHFSVLQEFLALATGSKVGRYYQISVNWHGYESVFVPMWSKACAPHPSPYLNPDFRHYPLISPGTDIDEWDKSLSVFLGGYGYAPISSRPWADPFFPDVAIPIVTAHDIYFSTKNHSAAITAVQACKAADWRIACTEWLQRRKDKAP